MTYQEAKEKALACSNYEDVEKLLHEIEEDYAISARQFYNLRYLAIKAAYEAE